MHTLQSARTAGKMWPRCRPALSFSPFGLVYPPALSACAVRPVRSKGHSACPCVAAARAGLLSPLPHLGTSGSSTPRPRRPVLRFLFCLCSLKKCVRAAGLLPQLACPWLATPASTQSRVEPCAGNSHPEHMRALLTKKYKRGEQAVQDPDPAQTTGPVLRLRPFPVREWPYFSIHLLPKKQPNLLLVVCSGCGGGSTPR